MEEFTHTWQYGGRTFRFYWLGNAQVEANRAYALAFTPTGQMLLVSDSTGSDFWLPGGGIEAGETAESALARELMEEAGATIQALKPLGIQRADDPVKGSSLLAYYWCHIALADRFVPAHEITRLLLIPPDQFLDTLFWGHTDPKAKVLLDLAMKLNQQYEQ